MKTNNAIIYENKQVKIKTQRTEILHKKKNISVLAPSIVIQEFDK